MQGRWKAIFLAVMSLLVGAFFTIVGYSVRGLLWERPAVEVKRVEADAATVAANAETQKALAEAAKAKAEAEKAIAEREKAFAELQTAIAQHKLAEAEYIKAKAQAAEVTFLEKVVDPHISDPMRRMGDLVDRIVYLEAKLEEPGLSTDARIKIFEDKVRSEKEVVLIQRAMQRKFQRTIDLGMGVIGYTVNSVKAQAGSFLPSPAVGQVRNAGITLPGEAQ